MTALLGAAVVVTAALAARPRSTRRWPRRDGPGGHRRRPTLPLHRFRSRRAAADDLWRTLPETTDLLALCLSAGHSVTSSIGVVAASVEGPVGAVLAGVASRHRLGAPIGDLLQRVVAAEGPEIATLCGALIAAHRDGGPAAVSLGRLADEYRAQRRRRAEARARRVPVTMLFPLVFCILPAFVLLAVVPLLAGSLPDLGSP